MKKAGIGCAILVLILLGIAACFLLLPPYFAASPTHSETVQDEEPPQVSPTGTADNAASTDTSAPSGEQGGESNEPAEQLTMDSLLREIIHGDGAAPGNELVTKPDACVMLGTPNNMAYLQKENLMIVINYGGIYAFDVASGAQRWHRYLFSTNGMQGASFRRQKIIGWSDHEVFLLDLATGKELWWRNNSPCGPIESAQLSYDETEIALTCKRGMVLYSVNTPSQRVRPRVPDAWFRGWLPGNKSLVFSQRADDKDSSHKFLFMDADSGVVTQGWEWGPKTYNTLSPQGQFAEGVDAGENKVTLRIREAQTGNVLREFNDIPGISTYLMWMQDGKRLVSANPDKTKTSVLDVETGTVLFTLSQEGHRFSFYWIFEDTEGNAWTFSQDEENSLYAWRIALDSIPKKLMDGNRLASGHIQINEPNQHFLSCKRYVKQGVWDETVYSLNDMRKNAKWRISISETSWYDSTINTDITYHVLSYPLKQNEGYSVENSRFSVRATDNEAAVYSGTGRPLGISPNGRYFLYQSDKNASSLYDLKTAATVRLYTAPGRENEEYDAYMVAAFSEDGRRMAINTSKTLEVTDLTDDYPVREMDTKANAHFSGHRLCFSPDGARLLCGGRNTAWLFDADTGALLHTFEENERYAQPWGGRNFLDGLATAAKDWVGRVTDQFKPGATLGIAFTEDGSKLITHAVGQVIRVWDAGSGNLLRTIHTGLPEKRNRDGYINNQITLSKNGLYALCYNGNGYGTAALWSLEEGILLRRYKFIEDYWIQGVPMDDGSAVYVKNKENLYRWPGAFAQYY